MYHRRGEKISQEVSKYHSAKTFSDLPPMPDIGSNSRRRPFVEVFDIHNGGTDGSVNPVDYEILKADGRDFDFYLQSLILVISDGSQNYSKYGAVNALLNGVDIYSVVDGEVNYLMEKAKTGGEALIWGASSMSVIPSNPGTITGWSANDDALVIPFDLASLIPPVGGLGGIRLGRGTKDGIYVTINDNLTGLSDHFVFLKGFKLYE